MKKVRSVFVLLFLAVVAGSAGWLGYRLGAPAPTVSRRVVVSQALLREIQQLNELITVRYVVQTAVGLEQERPPLGRERIVLLVRGHVEAGVKLDELTTADIVTDETRRSIEITLPPPGILNYYIDDDNTQVWERTKSWFVRYDETLDQKARQTARALILKTAMDMNVLKQARQFAEVSVRGLLQTLGFDHVTVRFHDEVAGATAATPAK